MLGVLIKVISAIAIFSIILMLFQVQSYFKVHRKVPPRNPKFKQSEADDGPAKVIPTRVDGSEVE